MVGRYVHSVGGYLPSLRLERKSVASALSFSGLGGRRDGFRAVAGWDEDALTLGIEAARELTAELAENAFLIFASTSAYFLDRSQSGLVLDALALARDVFTQDVSGSRRCATSALYRALEGQGDGLIVAGEARETRAGSSQQLSYGDGGAAVRVGDSGPVKYLGGASLTHDFVDLYTSRDHPAPYAYEERFVRDLAVSEIMAPAIGAALKKAGVEPSQVTLSAVAEPVTGVYPAIARKLGLAAPNIATDLATLAGDLGAAHALFAFGVALAKAKTGDIILLAGFGGGCDALLFEAVSEVAGADTVAAALQTGQKLTDYVRFLNLSGAIDLAWGMRSEFEQKAQATVLERYGRDIIGFVGGRDSTGNVQFPKSRIPVNPALHAPEVLTEVRLAEETGEIVSFTADRLNYTPDPPFDFGLVQFGNGARVMMEFTDRMPDGFKVGERVRMRLRIKAIDKRRGFRTYFWKAAPLDRPLLESQ